MKKFFLLVIVSFLITTSLCTGENRPYSCYRVSEISNGVESVSSMCFVHISEKSNYHTVRVYLGKKDEGIFNLSKTSPFLTQEDTGKKIIVYSEEIGLNFGEKFDNYANTYDAKHESGLTISELYRTQDLDSPKLGNF
ncbi:MAG: hypothetical protein JXA66_00435 [Oligoflexia bacterium]|nr:hypothetical protein [Oligoflexia bacterium]